MGSMDSGLSGALPEGPGTHSSTAVRKLPGRDLESSEFDHQERLRDQRAGMP